MSVLAALDTPQDRTSGIWRAFAAHKDTLAREWQAELQMEHDRVIAAFGSSIETLYEEA